jgi:hypothetical protein
MTSNKRTAKDEHIQKVLNILLQHPNGVDRRELVFLITGKPAMENILMDTVDRTNRAAIQALRNRGYLIISSTGKGCGGYRITNDRTLVENTISELESRRERMAEMIRGMRRAYGITPPATITPTPKTIQLELLHNLAKVNP